MQSIPKGRVTQPKHQERVSNKKTVSIIPKISEPNNLLPSILQLSKPVSHLFATGFSDVQTQSSSEHKLYQPNYNEDKYAQNSCIFQLTRKIQENSPQRRKIKNQLKYENLKLFFLSQTQTIIFLSRSICSILNKDQTNIFRQLISEKYLDLSQPNIKVSLDKEGITKLANILLEHQRFPFLCPQLNQKIELKSSFQNLILQQQQDSLIFNDNFQSSNILMVKQSKNIKQSIYCICTRFDYQTASYGQWFYFSVKRSKIQSEHQISGQVSNNKKSFKFVICNMTKQYSLLGVSMKISVCRNNVWGKQGQNIRYYQTYFHRSNTPPDEKILFTERSYHQFYYALQFDLDLQQGEQILVSYNEPYTVSRLSNLMDNFQRTYYEMEMISREKTQFYDVTTGNSEGDNYIHEQNEIQAENKKTKHEQIYYKRQIVSQTPLNNQISCLTFSIRKSSKKPIFKEQQLLHQQNQNSNKKIIFILARSHPIQTAGSFVVQGIIKHLFLFTEYKNSQKRRVQLKDYFECQSRDKLLQNLLKNFIIKIIPMINPDGVIIGNSRCNIQGFDLNRQWKRFTKTSCQQISSLKKYLLKFKDRIEMVIDLHGHSKERNVFAYGMHDFRDPFVTREFPFILSKLVSNNFSFNQCKFTRVKNVTKTKQSQQKTSPQTNSKQGTARIWLFRKLSIPNIFTIQNSYCSSSTSPFHYDSFSYGNIGKQILFSISMYYINFSLRKTKITPNQQKINNKSFLEDQFSEQSNKNTLDFDDLVKFKNSLIFDLKQNQKNASVGLDEINSSESEEQIRINDQFKPIRINQKQAEKEKYESPNKSNKAKSQRSLNKVLESSQKLNKIKLAISRNQNSSNLNNKKEQIYNFRLQTSKRIQTNEQSSPDLNQQKLNLSRRYSRNQFQSQTKSRISRIHYHKKSVSNNKSTTEFQKNAQLSVVEVGWDQSKFIEGKICETERIVPAQKDLANFPQIKSDANAIFIHRSNLTMKYKQLNKNLTSTQTERHPNSVTNSNQESLRSIQLKKNVSQFIKKLESNRKLQNEMIMTRKMQKYKQIIMKINGNN